jgi:hypothetical protein
LYVLIFTFLDSRREDKKLLHWMMGSIERISLLLIFSRIKFWYVTGVSKQLICATFSKDLIDVLTSWFCADFWWRDSNLCLDYSAFTSKPTSVIVPIEFLCFSLWNFCYLPIDLRHQHRPAADMSHLVFPDLPNGI